LSVSTFVVDELETIWTPRTVLLLLGWCLTVFLWPSWCLLGEVVLILILA
jgi:hypothetical protein